MRRVSPYLRAALEVDTAGLYVTPSVLTVASMLWRTEDTIAAEVRRIIFSLPAGGDNNSENVVLLSAIPRIKAIVCTSILRHAKRLCGVDWLTFANELAAELINSLGVEDEEKAFFVRGVLERLGCQHKLRLLLDRALVCSGPGRDRWPDFWRFFIGDAPPDVVHYLRIDSRLRDGIVMEFQRVWRDSMNAESDLDEIMEVLYEATVHSVVLFASGATEYAEGLWSKIKLQMVQLSWSLEEQITWRNDVITDLLKASPFWEEFARKLLIL